jgi:hypothetical protein
MGALKRHLEPFSLILKSLALFSAATFAILLRRVLLNATQYQGKACREIKSRLQSLSFEKSH